MRRRRRRLVKEEEKERRRVMGPKRRMQGGDECLAGPCKHTLHGQRTQGADAAVLLHA